MQKKHLFKKLNKSVLLLIITCALTCFSFDGYAQEDKKAEEGIKLTRGAQTALLAAQEFFENEDYTNARTPILEYFAANAQAEEPEVVPEVVYVYLAQLWYLDKEPEEAQKVYMEGYTAYPKSKDLLGNYAAVTYELEQFHEAGQLFEKLYEVREEKDIEDLNNAAACYYYAEELDDTIRVYNRMIASTKEPESDWYEMIISLYMEQKNDQKAEEYILKALDIFPLEKRYWQLLADLRLDNSDYAGAASALEIGYRVEPPENRNEWNYLLDLYNYLNLPLRTAKCLESILEKGASNEDDQIKISQMYANTMRVEKAVSYLDSLISKKPSEKLLMQKAQILYDARRNKEAIKALDECIEFAPKNGLAYYIKGFTAWDMEDWETAKEAFTMAKNFKEYSAQSKDALAILADLDRAKTE